MHSATVPPRFGNRPVAGFLAVILFLLVSTWYFDGSGFSIAQLLGSSEYLLRFLREAFPPIDEHRLTFDQSHRYSLALIETFQMAFAGTLLGIVIGFILALFASRGLMFESRRSNPLQWSV